MEPMTWWKLILCIFSIFFEQVRSEKEKLVVQGGHEWDANGYVFFCLCMGRFGNQVEHFLGGAAFAKALNRTLVIPPWITYKAVPFIEWFKLEPLQKYHKVILAEDFMKYLAPIYWPVGKRKGYCWLPRGSKDKCVMKAGFPFKVFWDELQVDFDDYVTYHLSMFVEDEFNRVKWQERFPPSKHPVLAFRGAPASYPLQKHNVPLQKLLQWSEGIEKTAANYIYKNLRPGKFVGIHLRNEEAWIKGCEFAEGAPSFMESPQCLGYSRYHKVTQDLCAPPKEEIFRAVKERIMEINAKFLFIATDNNPMIKSFRDILSPLNVTIRHLNPERPQIDLAILGKSDHFIGNCISSFTAFVKRQRDFTNLPSSFWAFKN